MDRDFIFCGASAERKCLKQLSHNGDLDIIIDSYIGLHVYVYMIQSGRDVTLDNNTCITFYAFIPPTKFR